MQKAGLLDNQVERKGYQIAMSLDEYLEYKAHALGGRFLIHTLEPKTWQEFRLAAADELRARFGESVAFSKDALLAIATKA